jgi:hypothetical protein
MLPEDIDDSLAIPPAADDFAATASINQRLHHSRPKRKHRRGEFSIERPHHLHGAGPREQIERPPTRHQLTSQGDPTPPGLELQLRHDLNHWAKGEVAGIDTVRPATHGPRSLPLSGKLMAVRFSRKMKNGGKPPKMSGSQLPLIPPDTLI